MATKLTLEANITNALKQHLTSTNLLAPNGRGHQSRGRID
jgi:hypothetical protein